MMATASVSPKSNPLAPIVGAMIIGAAVTGFVVWRMALQGVDRQIAAKRSAIKKLVLSGNIPPSREAADYLAARQVALEERYASWLSTVATPPVSDAGAQADPQLYFQERSHDLQRTLERLATARTLPVPEQLGLPKELPPSDTVPRLLVQLALMEEIAELAYGHEVSGLASLKAEDPEPVAGGEGQSPFVIRLPVRVRLTATLARFMKMLGALEQKQPLIDLRSVRVTPQQDGATLDIELVAARYLALANASPGMLDEEAQAAEAPARKRPARKSGAPASAPRGARGKPPRSQEAE
jgi:hypothetical protein